MESPNTDLNATISPDQETLQPTNLKVELHPSCQETDQSSHSPSTCSSPDSPLAVPFNKGDEDDDNQSIPSNEDSPYRIPNSVFASRASPGEWSMASNESLFSIHGDNTSFKNEYFPFWRSGELDTPPGYYHEEASTSDQMFSYSDQQPRLCTESSEPGLAEATMKEVIRETESNHDHPNDKAATTSLAIPSRSSYERSTSTTSYAFAMKAGDSERGDLSRTPSSVRSNPEENAVQYQSPPSPQVMTEPPEQVTEAESPTHGDQAPDPGDGEAPPKKWSLFPCC